MTEPCQRDGQHGQVGRGASHVPPTAISPSPGVTPSTAAGPRVTPALVPGQPLALLWAQGSVGTQAQLGNSPNLSGPWATPPQGN